MASRTPGDVARTVAQNFIKSYGLKKFQKLIELLKRNAPGPAIADEFGVTRQRVHQWKSQLGKETVIYELDDEVQKILGVPSQTRKLV